MCFGSVEISRVVPLGRYMQYARSGMRRIVGTGIDDGTD